MKKLAIIGRGTAGIINMTHFLRYTDWEIDWYFDDSIKPQAIGEGSDRTLSTLLYNNLNFDYSDLDKIDGTLKTGNFKKNWSNTSLFHNFQVPSVGFHFNAIKLQDYVLSSVRNNPRITIKEQNIKNSDVDSDFVMDCSGKPNDYDLHNRSEYMAVNAAYVTQCYWDYPTFNHTLSIARPYGWVFGIPLRNRCAIGYLHNDSINTIEEIKHDVLDIFKDYNLTPSDTTNLFKFNSYYRKRNFDGRVCYNGNASFFLEPLEANSINIIDGIQRHAYDMWVDNFSCDNINELFQEGMCEVEVMIMLHYLAGSIYKTPFWNMAKEKSENCLRNNIAKGNLLSFMVDEKNKSLDNELDYGVYGTWSLKSWAYNIEKLGLYPKLRELRGE